MATFNGTDGNDVLPPSGADTSGNDLMRGFGGNDTLIGGGGNDTLDGGTGDDLFYIGGTGFGTDYFIGGDGADEVRFSSNVITSSLLLDAAHMSGTETLNFNGYSLRGTGGADLFDLSGVTFTRYYQRIDLNDGNDLFIGHQGDDYVDGGSGNDTLRGGSGDDVLTGGSGNDLLDGGSGNDLFYIGGTGFGTDYFNGGDGADQVRFSSNVITSSLLLDAAHVSSTETLNFNGYSLRGTGGADVFNFSAMSAASYYQRIYMNDGNDLFIGYQGNDNVDGGSGNDTLRGGAGNDTLIGGSGNDVLDGGSGDDMFYIGGNDFGNDVYNGGDGHDQIRLSSDIETARLVLTGNVISTESLNMNGYEIEGTGGADVFDFSGIGIIYNYDTVELEDGNDTFIGHAGNDFVEGDSGNDLLIGLGGNDRLDGGDGVDTAGYGAASGGVRVNLSLSSAQVIGGGQGTDTLISIENVNGSRFNDVLTGSGVNNVLNGAVGNDQLFGLAGNDLLLGGAGNDLLNGGAGNDTLNGGAGIDTAGYGGATSGVTVDLRNAGLQTIGGGQGADQLIGIENVNGSGFNDHLIGNFLANILTGGAGNDRLDGLDGNDRLIGNQGADLLFGGAGNDTLMGGIHNDTLVGGAGADVFFFGLGDNADRINDWQDGVDRIQIDAGMWQGRLYDDFSDLSIRQSAAGAVVSFGGTSITLAGVSASVLGASDFNFV